MQSSFFFPGKENLLSVRTYQPTTYTPVLTHTRCVRGEKEATLDPTAEEEEGCADDDHDDSDDLGKEERCRRKFGVCAPEKSTSFAWRKMHICVTMIFLVGKERSVVFLAFLPFSVFLAHLFPFLFSFPPSTSKLAPENWSSLPLPVPPPTIFCRHNQHQQHSRLCCTERISCGGREVYERRRKKCFLGGDGD